LFPWYQHVTLKFIIINVEVVYFGVKVGSFHFLKKLSGIIVFLLANTRTHGGWGQQLFGHMPP
jgi:hypothetical protein